jgi:hypothetical protein
MKKLLYNPESLDNRLRDSEAKRTTTPNIVYTTEVKIFFLKKQQFETFESL